MNTSGKLLNNSIVALLGTRLSEVVGEGGAGEEELKTIFFF